MYGIWDILSEMHYSLGLKVILSVFVKDVSLAFFLIMCQTGRGKIIVMVSDLKCVCMHVYLYVCVYTHAVL